MMARPPFPPAHRTVSALAALGVVGVIGAAMVLGLRPQWQEQVRSALVAVDVISPPPPPPEPRPKPPPSPPAPENAAKGDPGERNLKNRATPVFAPPVQAPLIVPPPIVAAPVPNVGSAASNGASTLPGPGQGAGGFGNGLGGGGSGGNGTGVAKGPRQISGRLSYDDLPQGLLQTGQEAGAEVRYTVNPDGSVSNCRIDRSSGYPTLDAAACRLIEQRFRFRPARDRAGRAVPSTVAEEHVWVAREED